ncbi:MAG: polyvinylalcohol dehydrogenase, partial [Verrucomicrobiota bacterium]
DYIYGGDGQNRGRPTCLHFATGEVKWKQFRPPEHGSAAVIYADGHILFRYDRGLISVVEATPDAYRVKSSFKPQLGKGPAWAHPVIHQSRLYLRHDDQLFCYDLGGQ